MTIEKAIQNKVTTAFAPIHHIELTNESNMHNVPEGAETHFRLLLVSEIFEGMSRIERQRKVMEVLAEELAGEVHALTQRVFTVKEWDEKKESLEFQSPKCRGGEKSSS